MYIDQAVNYATMQYASYMHKSGDDLFLDVKMEYMPELAMEG